MVRGLAVLLLSLLATVAPASESPGQASAPQLTTTLMHAEAVRSDWNATEPPATGWVPVTLMDQWQQRWPDHDGVVWYRVRWRQDGPGPVGLMLDYTCLAAAVYVNGSLVDRDPSLVEPLSRYWHSPRYYLVDAPLLRPGENELLVRVSGLVAYQPAFGTVTVGAPDAVQRTYRGAKLARHDLQLLDASIGLVLAAVFGLIWLLRPRDTTYGWYALNGLFGMLYASNYIVTRPWPFPTTHGWQAFIAACFVAAAVTYALFLLRFAGLRWPRFERSLLALGALVFAAALLFPGWMGPYRNAYVVPMIGFAYLMSLAFAVFAFRHGRAEHKVLALCALVPVLVSLHDLSVYLGWFRGSAYLGAFGSPITLLGMGFVLAYRFASTMKRVEGFNAELRHEVEAATTRLADTLGRQHALELAHGRAGERLQLVRDLHDGFGGTLVGAIARLQQSPADMPNARVVDLLREMRDDLRLVIDSTAREHADLGELLVPLRHRATRLLEAADIDAHWHLAGLDGVDLGSGRSLDLLRLLQEALTNVFKHSGAGRVDVHVQRDGAVLRVGVRDDGVGLQAGEAARAAGGEWGTGLASMRLRAQRLGGRLQVETASDGGTALRLELPLAA